MTTTPRLVTTQVELDAALAEGVADLIVDAPGGAYLEIRHDGFVRLRGSSRAVLRDSSSAELWDSSRAVLRDSSSAVLRGSSRAELRGSSSAVLWDSSRAELRDSSRAVLRGSSSAELRESSSADAGRFTVVHVWSQRVTLTGEGHVINMNKVDLTDVDAWRAYVGADTLVRPDRDQLIVGHVSSQDHDGRLHKDGQIKIGCFYGTVPELRELADGDDWPSHAGPDVREKHRPRLLAFADLCEQQLAAWAEVES